MKNFMYHIPTKIHFGKGEISNLADSIKEYGSRVLLVYGGGSIKKIGLYDTVINILKENDIYYEELSGVEPNPRVTTAEKGVKLCRDNDLDLVLAVGGGSAIDCGKIIAAGVHSDGELWDIVIKKEPIKKVLPVISVLTLAATGSEMDTSAIITNEETNEKTGPSNPGMRPVVSILDPEYSFTVPKNQTAAGTADIMSHVMEVYFNNNPGAYLQNRFCEAVLKTCVEYGLKAYNDPEDYEARANLMWASSWAINGLLAKGNPVSWSVHPIGHELSAHYDTTHGVGLAILIPHWLRHMMKEDNLYKYVEYGVQVWGIDPKLDDKDIAEKSIEKTVEFFKAMDIPSTLTEVGIDNSKFEEMAEVAGASLQGAFVPMDKEDVLVILNNAL